MRPITRSLAMVCALGSGACVEPEDETELEEGETEEASAAEEELGLADEPDPQGLPPEDWEPPGGCPSCLGANQCFVQSSYGLFEIPGLGKGWFGTKIDTGARYKCRYVVIPAGYQTDAECYWSNVTCGEYCWH